MVCQVLAPSPLTTLRPTEAHKQCCCYVKKTSTAIRRGEMLLYNGIIINAEGEKIDN
jgi:hypothetical protein